MTKEIYEKKHLFSAVFDAVLFTMIPVFALAVLIVLPTARNTAFEAEWMHVALVVTLAVLGVFLLVMGPFTLWERYRRYMDLCIGGQPAVIIGDDELQFYSPKGEYMCYRWDEIERFKLTHSKMFSSIQPILKESWRNPKWYALFFAVYTHTIRTDYLDMPEDELLNELNAHLR
jgi:Na+/melibiose symporter-like transporter